MEETAQVQHGAKEVQPRQQESSGAVHQLFRAQGEADHSETAAGQGLQGHRGLDGRLGAAET